MQVCPTSVTKEIPAAARCSHRTPTGIGAVIHGIATIFFTILAGKTFVTGGSGPEQDPMRIVSRQWAARSDKGEGVPYPAERSIDRRKRK